MILYLTVVALCAGCMSEFGAPPPEQGPNSDGIADDGGFEDPSEPGPDDLPPQSLSIRSATPLCCDELERNLEALIDGQPAPPGSHCTWDFGDGRTGQGCRVPHRFPWAKSYITRVMVELPDGTILSAVQTLSVGNATDSGGDDGGGVAGDDDDAFSVDVGPDRRVIPGEFIRLVGRVKTSTPLGRVQYLWKQLEGPRVALLDAATATASFEVPHVTELTTLRFSFTATTGGRTARDEISIYINQMSPEDLVQLHGFANADWWGFNRSDATDAIQSAIDSGASTVIIPDVGSPWIVRPLLLRSDMELILEPNVMLQAKRGAYLGANDVLLLLDGATDVRIVGNGATLRMNKDDYKGTEYVPSEWRHGISLRGAKNVQIEGVRVERTGGDGIYIGPGLDAERSPCQNIVIKNCVCSESYRQGMSIVSGRHVLVTDCIFEGTLGTAPQAGLDLEPAFGNDELVDIEIRNCLARGNAGTGFMTNLTQLDANSAPVSMRLVDCAVKESIAPGLRAILRENRGATGNVDFIRCTVEDTYYAAVALVWDLGSPIEMVFSQCRWMNVARRKDQPLLYFGLKDQQNGGDVGGITFLATELHNENPRVVLKVGSEQADPFSNLRGTISLFGLRPDDDARAELPLVPNLRLTYRGASP